MILTINNTSYSINKSSDIITVFDNIEEKCDILLFSNEESPSLTVLKNGDRAFLMYLKFSGDIGFTSRSNYDQSPINFTLSNGQVDHYPGNWTIPFSQAKDAIMHFVKTQKMIPGIKWNDDSNDQSFY